MTKFLPAFVAVALLASASTVAAQDEYRVAYGDLKLSSATDANAFDHRINRSARRACGGQSPLQTLGCVRRFRDEAMRQLPTLSRDDYARARNGDRVVAQVPRIAG